MRKRTQANPKRVIRVAYRVTRNPNAVTVSFYPFHRRVGTHV